MNNDLISREALREAFENLASDDYNEPIWYQKTVFEIIDNAPTVTPKQGEWKVYGKQGGIPITDRCSNCKYEMMWYKNKYNYCPNCGADMQKGGES